MKNKGIIISYLPQNGDIEILGHTFHGLRELEDAVDVRATVTGNAHWGRSIFRERPRRPVEGLHVLCMSEHYPCFDSYDYASENRYYRNYFFSTHPFTDGRINRLGEMKCHCNYRLVSEEMSRDALPAIYFGGDTGDLLLLARLE